MTAQRCLRARSSLLITKAQLRKDQVSPMSEAHEKTRIRQLEDAVAHWEHKYANARQYNRNLEERNQKLEAALSACQIECHNLSHRKGEYHGHDVPCPVEARINALLTPAETKGE